jgi:hypothetical protein
MNNSIQKAAKKGGNRPLFVTITIFAICILRYGGSIRPYPHLMKLGCQIPESEMSDLPQKKTYKYTDKLPQKVSEHRTIPEMMCEPLISWSSQADLSLLPPICTVHYCNSQKISSRSCPGAREEMSSRIPGHEHDQIDTHLLPTFENMTIDGGAYSRWPNRPIFSYSHDQITTSLISNRQGDAQMLSTDWAQLSYPIVGDQRGEILQFLDHRQSKAECGKERETSIAAKRRECQFALCSLQFLGEHISQ